MRETLGSRLNLAQRPFVNRTRVRRFAVTLWVLALALLLINGWLFLGYQSDSSEGRAELRQLREAMAAAEASARDLDRELQSFDLANQNLQVTFLNQKLAARRFPWGLLFDHLVAALPREVRLTSLAPRNRDQRRRASAKRGGAEDSWIVLEIAGEAQEDEAMLAFLDALFLHPAFSEPSLLGEAKARNGVLTFNLETKYRIVPGQERPGEPSPSVDPATASGLESGGGR